MEVDIPKPNAAIAALLVSPRMHAIVEERGHMAQRLFQAEVAKRSGRLAGSARVQTEIGGRHHDRWVSHMIIGTGVEYGAAHQFGHWQDEGNLIGAHQGTGESHVFVDGAHDLNRVLEQLGGL